VTAEADLRAATAADDEVRAEIAALAGHAFGAADGDGDGDGGPWEAIWAELGGTGLLALAVPERCGGEGLGIGEAFAVLYEAGRRAADVPALATLALGVLPLVRWGTPGQQDDALAPVVTDRAVLTAALNEPSAPLTTAPRTTARRTPDGGFVLDGVKTAVPYAGDAHRVLVPAALDDTGDTGDTAGRAAAVFLVDPRAPGVAVTPAPASGGGSATVARLALTGVTVGADALLPGGSAALVDLHRLAAAGAAVTADGLLAGALALTAEHVRTREQFGRPLATFQAVAQNLADVYVAARIVHLVARGACDALAAGAPAGDAVADPEVAAAWVTDEVRAAIGTCHHLHGGVGLDRSYPLHRFSAASTDLAHLLGGADAALDALAAQLFTRDHARPVDPEPR
jgi:alkylation response protein AidB-like acyl-CoA dehydrogenase